MFRALLLRGVLVVLCSAFACVHAKAGNLTLIDGRKTDYRILVPAKPTAGEAFAGGELLRCLQEAARCRTLAVVKDGDPAKGKFLIVSRADHEPAKALLAGADAPALPKEDDAILVATVGDDVLLTGRGDRGVIYAVHDFLEREVGCAWLFQGRLGEVIPRVSYLAIRPTRRAHAPSFPFRSMGRGEWGLRNFQNIRVKVRRYDPSVGLVHGGHSFRRILPVEKYFDAHPDYYALVAGKRQRSRSRTHGNQYCTSNPALVRQVVANMRADLDKNPGARVISLSPNDGLGFCECPNCMALDEKGPYTIIDRQRGKHIPIEYEKKLISRRMLIFYNHVCRELAKTHPDVLVKSFAYSAYTAPPDDPTLRCEPNLMIQLTHNLCHNHAMTDARCRYNPIYRRYIEGWAKRGENLAIYEYYWKVAWLDMPWPILHAMRKDIPWYREQGVKYLYTQYGANDAGGFGLVYYVAARLAWDVDADVDALVKRFCEKAYGKGAPAMLAYYDLWEREMAASNEPIGLGPPVNAVLRVFTPANLDKADALLKQAREAADSPAARQRVDLVGIQMQWARLVSR